MFCKLIFAAMLAFSANSAAAITAWDTITGETVTGAAAPAVDTNYSHGLQFLAEHSGIVTSIDVFLGKTRDEVGTSFMRFGFFTNEASEPGASIGDWVATSTDVYRYSVSEVTNLTGFGAVTLTAGTSYWLVAEGVSGVNGNWLTTGSTDGVRKFFYNGSWHSTNRGSLPPAARITVEPAVVPLPAGLPLLIGGLAALALVRRRRS